MLNTIKRKSLIEDICLRFHPEGLERLSEVGHFDKYTPLFHYRIAEPVDDAHIFITELFGSQDEKPSLQNAFRKQYHGSFKGLGAVIMQGLGAEIEPYHGTINANPSFQIHGKKPHLQKKDKERFDHALQYLHAISRFDVPETMRKSTYSETFARTYHIL